MAEARISVPEGYVISRERVEETGDAVGFQAMKSLLDLKPRPDAVFCYNDLTAVGAVEAIIDARLRVPEDVAVIGCGNFRYAKYLKVPLSSIDQGTAELGRIAGEFALDLSKNPQQPPRSVVLKPTLQVRQSTVS